MSERYREPEQRFYRPVTNVESEREWEVMCLSEQFKDRKCPTRCPFYLLAKAKVMADNGRTDLKGLVQREIQARFDPNKCANQQTVPPVR